MRLSVIGVGVITSPGSLEDSVIVSPATGVFVLSTAVTVAETDEIPSAVTVADDSCSEMLVADPAARAAAAKGPQPASATTITVAHSTSHRTQCPRRIPSNPGAADSDGRFPLLRTVATPQRPVITKTTAFVGLVRLSWSQLFVGDGADAETAAAQALATPATAIYGRATMAPCSHSRPASPDASDDARDHQGADRDQRERRHGVAPTIEPLAADPVAALGRAEREAHDRSDRDRAEDHH